MSGQYSMFNNLAKEVHKGNVAKGFYDPPKEIGTILMLIVSELGEALEADRKRKFASIVTYKHCQTADDMFEKDKPAYLQDCFEKMIKDSFEDEIADTFIRLLDLCGYLNIDIDFHIQEKLKYNMKRPLKHGKKY